VNDPRSSHHRRSIRLRDYDYAQAGAYFVTICVQDRALLFGEVANDVMVLSDIGQVAQQAWLDLPGHFENIELEAFAIMPNHMHGILLIMDTGDTMVGAQSGSLSAILQNYNSVTTRKINRMRDLAGKTVWQRNYHERIIRDQRELEAKRDYIASNPLQWALDAENPDHPR
jgi:putative transposase